MVEPENLVVALLREMRHDNAMLRQDMIEQFNRLGARLDEVNKRLEAVSQLARGESVLARYAALEMRSGGG